MIFRRIRAWLGGSHGDGNGREMVSCEEALERLYEYMDGELGPVPHEQVEEHFRVCTRCYPHLTLERSFRARVQEALSKPEVPGDLRDRVLELLGQEEFGT